MMELFKGAVTPKDYMISGGIAGAALLLCAAFYFLVYTTGERQLDELSQQDQKVLADLNLARDTQRNIEKLRAEAEKNNKLVTQFEQRLPESREIPMLLKQFEGFAGEIGLQVQLSQGAPIKDNEKALETSPYSVKAWGDFHQIANFINRLERFQRYLKVSDLKISQEEEGVAEASFTLSTFRFLQPAEPKENEPAKGSHS